MNYKKIILRFYLLTGVFFLCILNDVFSQNLVKNPGFETGLLTPFWRNYSMELSPSSSNDANNVFEGEFCAKLESGNVYFYQPVNLEPNTTYKISVAIKTESGDSILFGVSNVYSEGGESIYFLNDTNYETVSLTFTTDESPGNQPNIYIWKDVESGIVWADNFVMIIIPEIIQPKPPGGFDTFYVSLQGNDLNTGLSPEHSWQTINKINSVDFGPGDQILFKGGDTFNGTIVLNKDDYGTSDNKVQFGSYGTGRAIINAQTGSGLIAYDCDNISIKNLNFTGAGPLTGNTGNGITFSYCSDIIIDSVEVSGFQHSGLMINNIGENYQITNINAHDNGYAGIYLSGMDKPLLSNIYIGYCTADNNPGDPTVLNNHSGNGIFAYNASNLIIEYCKASNNGWNMPRTGNGPGGIWVAEVDSAIIQYCISHDNKTSIGGQDGLGFDLDGGTTNSIIQYCLSYNNWGAGYGIFQYNGATDWSNNTVRYCISENDGNTSAKGSVYFWNGSGNINKFQGFEFYNNVVYNANGPALAFLDHKNLNFNFRNNIFISKESSVYNGINGENFQGNCWYSLNGEFYLNSAIDFNTWAQTSNQEILNSQIVGMYANPRFINPGSSNLTNPLLLATVEDYKVEESSVVIDKGLDLELLFDIVPGTRDYFGNTLNPHQYFDMGIYQYLDKQFISFIPGWNIMSSAVEPSNPDLESVLQSMISENSLIKVQDEEGNSLEYLSILGDWNNNIGNMALTEGYKVKVSKNDTVEICGPMVKYPYPILLKLGWNIIGYPQTIAFDGLEVMKQLIDKGVLIKVQDETGSSIEYLSIHGEWTNNIGDFKEGEGYKVKVSADDTLWITSSYPKSNKITPKIINTTHFQPVFEGNGIDHMNIYLFGLPFCSLQAGDELAVFDGLNCVGAVKLMPHHLRNNFVSIVVSAKDNQGMNGFIQGNLFTLKLWNSKQNREYILEPEIVKGTSTFAKHETTIASLENYAVTVLEGQAGFNQPEINCYPNPFSEEVNIEIKLAKDSEIQVEVLNQLGQRVKTLATERILNNGTHLLKWNGKNTANQQVSSGIYMIRIMIGSEISFKKIIYSKVE